MGGKAKKKSCGTKKIIKIKPIAHGKMMWYDRRYTQDYKFNFTAI
jgi:hypothetical protein